MAKSIIIDPGHGGTDNGASAFGVKEKDWNLKISLYQYDRLKELGANVGITRTNDKSLNSTQRTNLIKNKYDVAISNHWNAFNGSARGIETIHSKFGGKEFATNIAQMLLEVTGLPLRRIFTRTLDSGSDYYFMHRMTGNTRTIIIEYGFLDNRQDHNWYKNESNFFKAAEAVIKAVCKEIGIKYTSPNGKPVKNTTPAPKPKPASKPSNSVSGAKLVKNENAYFLVTADEGIKVRSEPSTKATHTGTLPEGASINYHRVYEGNGYRWLQYTGHSGNTLYVPYRPSNDVKNQWGTFHSSRPSSKPKRTVKQLADEVERSGITGNKARAKYLGLTESEYKPVRDEINKRYN